MIRQLYKFLFCFIFLPILIPAQTGSSIKIFGNKFLTEKELLYSININPSDNKEEKIDSVKAGLRKIYSSNGFFHSGIDSILFDQTVIKIFIDEGDPSILDSISINCSTPNDSSIYVSFFRELTGNIFIPSIFNERIEKLLTHFENTGYPFAKVTVNKFYWKKDDSHMINIELNIDLGGLQKINKVIITGNEKTEDDVIIREIGFTPNMIYSQEMIDQIQPKLKKLNFFSQVEPPAYLIDKSGKGILMINLKEKNTNNFDGIVGYVPSKEENENGYFTGKVDVSLRNLFGTGRAFAFRWEAFERESQEFELKYLEPWIAGYPVSLKFDLYQRKQDSSYVQRSLSSQIEFLAFENITGTILLGVGQTIAGTNSSLSNFYNSNYYDTGISLKYDSRDDLFNPLSGILFINSYTYRRKNISLPSKNNGDKNSSIGQQKIQLDFAIYNSFFTNQVLAISLHGRELRGDEIDPADLFWFGGTKTLRGYREKQFNANRLLWINSEYRFLLGSRSYLFLLYDYGYSSRNENKLMNIAKAENYLSGYGFGITLDTNLGLLSVSYAISKGSSLTQGLIHFGIINEF